MEKSFYFAKVSNSPNSLVLLTYYSSLLLSDNFLAELLVIANGFPAGIYLLKVNNRNTIKGVKYVKDTRTAPSVSINDFKHAIVDSVSVSRIATRTVRGRCISRKLF